MLTILQSLSSASSAHSHQDETLPHGEPQPLNVLPIASPPEAPQDDSVDTPRSLGGIQTLKRWIPTRVKKNNKGPTLDGPDGVPIQSDQAAAHQPRLQSPARVDDRQEGPSWMAAARPTPVSVVPR